MSSAPAPDSQIMAARDAALQALAPGPLLRIASGATEVEVAPRAGGRIARIAHAGVEWLLPHAPRSAAAIAWGCYPMVPWAGRLRHGRFSFAQRTHSLPANLGPHAIHGLGFVLPWSVTEHRPDAIELSLHLPEDERWPFGGMVRQSIRVGGNELRLELTLTAGAQAMPAMLGWHPWLRKPDAFDFAPQVMYPRDADGIAHLPLVPPASPPWDDCFVHPDPITLRRAGQTLRLSSDCNHWVVFDGNTDAICFEPQTGPPDAFNSDPQVLSPQASIQAWFEWAWR